IVDLLGPGMARDVFVVLNGIATIGGLGFSYFSLFEYLPRARTALVDGRRARKVNS
ncbi:MAG: hypothetical protein JHD17_05220, partial [Acidimicrobiia bacterium]|nr:hypothetical protein [Acidimicrobiia bacterium]